MARKLRRTCYMVLACLAATSTLAHAQAARDRVARGAYLARVGDCAGCHSRAGQPAYAGGDYIDSPFGRIAPPNITPDRKDGIGAWNDDQFYAALHLGVDRNGQNLYPAMPYPWFTKVTRDDALAIKAYLFSLPPAPVGNRRNHMIFPFNVRAGIAGWNAIYFKAGTFAPDSSRSADWNRGAYLVQGLGHCAACHTPKNALMSPIQGEAFAGGEVDHWYAPNLTSDTKQGLGAWSREDIVSYLKNGAAPGKGVAIGPMKQVHESLAQLSDSDLGAIATYLKSLPAKSSYGKPVLPSQVAYASGADIYTTNCAACHQPDGQGLPGAVPPLAGNGAVTAKGPDNILRAVVGGLPAQGTYAAMPGFATRLTPRQIADVANYVRASWGNGAPVTATADQVAVILPKTTSMLAATQPCEKPDGSPVGQLVTDSNVQATLASIDDNNELTQVDRLISQLRQKLPRSQNAEIVNQLTAAYCPYVFNNAAAPKDRRAASLDQFAALVYTQLHASQ